MYLYVYTYRFGFQELKEAVKRKFLSEKNMR